ncbi:hypothetical protein K474DRAFT_1706522 [Panus rudis PR-1116 ss-1]|nr:hypothetical protein K474DRAFT_1706522 [Panus rudis PR-1116 ss-1]
MSSRPSPVFRPPSDSGRSDYHHRQSSGPPRRQPPLRSRSSSRSSEYKRQPQLEIAIPRASQVHGDSADSLASTPHTDRSYPRRFEAPQMPPTGPVSGSVAPREPNYHADSQREQRATSSATREDVQSRDQTQTRPATGQRESRKMEVASLIDPPDNPQPATSSRPDTQAEPLASHPSVPSPPHPEPSTEEHTRDESSVIPGLATEPTTEIERSRDGQLDVDMKPQESPEEPRKSPSPEHVTERDVQTRPDQAIQKVQEQTQTTAPLSPVESRTNIQSPLPPPTPAADPEGAKSTEVPPALRSQIPEDSESIGEALRMVVMMRHQYDYQTRDDRVDPILLSNQLIAEPAPPPEIEDKSDDALVDEIVNGARRLSLETSYQTTRPSLEVRFAQRRHDVDEKVKRLRAEYKAYQEKWLVHCAKLDDVARTSALEEAAAAASRTTRRNTTTLGDAVRTDLEMEQIIASLGNEELTDASSLGSKNAAIIPNMITVTDGPIEYVYDDTNNEVEDPAEFYQTKIDYWSEEEEKIFQEKYAQYPKQFGIIADFLEHKTPAQCVTYYYLHKKRDIDFRKIVAQYVTGKKRRGGRRADKKRSNALLADILQRDAEMSREPTPSTGRRGRPPGSTAESRKAGGRRAASGTQGQQAEDTSTPNSTPGPDIDEPRKKRRRTTTARAAAAAEQEALLDEIEEAEKNAKRGRRGRKPKNLEIVMADSPTPSSEQYPTAPQETRFIDQTDLAIRKKTGQGSSIWTEEDKALFLKLLGQYGDDFKRIAASMPNKTTVQVSTFYKANAAELARVAASAPKRSPSPRDTWQGFPGSGMVTPSSGAVETPPEGSQSHFSGAHLDSHLRHHMQTSGGQVHNHPIGYRQSHSEEMSYQFHSTSLEAMHAQYGPRETGHPFTSTPLPVNSNHPYPPPMSSMHMPPLPMPVSMDQIANPSPFATSNTTFTTTFPSTFPYTNLSPSHFAAGGSSSRPDSRLVAPGIHQDAPPLQHHPPPGSHLPSFPQQGQNWPHQGQRSDMPPFLDSRTPR